MGELSPADRRELENLLSVDDDPELRRMLRQLTRGKGASTVREQIEQDIYETSPVDVETFVRHPHYLGKIVRHLSERWVDELKKVFDDNSSVVTWVFTGAIGVGKTTVSTIAQCYKIYRLCCLNNPQLFYDLNPADRIVFALFNITLRKGETGYDLFRYYLENSPWFQENCPVRKRPADPILLPKKNVSVVLGSLSTHALGEHIFGFTMDEANFFKSRADVEGETRAHAIYQQAYTRTVSRYLQKGGSVPGLMCLISSRKTQSAFLEEQIEKARNQTKKTLHVSSFALWDIRSEKIGKRRFRVMVGDDKRSSRILENDELAPKGYRVIQVPEEFRDRFEWDVDDSLRDIAGVATTGTFHFFPRREFLERCVDSRLFHPFGVSVVDTLGLRMQNNLSEYIDEDRMFCVRNSLRQPRLSPGSPRYVHCDIGLTQDALGLACCHRTKINGQLAVEFDFMIRIKAPSGDEVHLDKIIGFLKYLRANGMPIRSVTYDRFQSRHSVQDLQVAGFEADFLSVKLEQYMTLKDLVSQGLCRWYRYEPLMKELRELVKDPDGQKRPNHPLDGSDDVADAVAASAWACHQSDASPVIDARHAPFLAVGDALLI
jgi:hypothetical protein